MAEEQDKGNISDGYHTFNELYEHRHALFIALCRSITHLKKHGLMDVVWRSKRHSDGSCFDGWFIMGVDTGARQASYHLPERLWEETEFAETRDKAPEWNGYTSDDVLDTIYSMFGWVNRWPKNSGNQSSG